MNARFVIGMMVLVTLVFMAIPASAAINKISPEGDVFIGEKGLDISDALGGSSQIAWWGPGTNIETELPYEIPPISDEQSFDISPDIFFGKTGPWYQWDGSARGPVAFHVKDPSLNIQIWDGTSEEVVSGKSVSSGNYVNFVIETNMQSIIERSGYQPDDAPFEIKVQNAGSTIYSHLVDSTDNDIPLTNLAVDQKSWYWIGVDNDHSLPAPDNGWNTAADDIDGNPLYLAGTYSVWVECNANDMMNQYTAPDGSFYMGKTISAVKKVQITNGEWTPIHVSPYKCPEGQEKVSCQDWTMACDASLCCGKNFQLGQNYYGMVDKQGIYHPYDSEKPQYGDSCSPDSIKSDKTTNDPIPKPTTIKKETSFECPKGSKKIKCEEAWGCKSDNPEEDVCCEESFSFPLNIKGSEVTEFVARYTKDGKVLGNNIEGTWVCT